MRKITKYSAAAALMLLCAFAVSPLQAAETVKAGWVGADNGAAVDSLNLLAGEEATIRLESEVPENKTLKAYSFIIMYDETAVKVKQIDAAPDAAISPASINDKTPGELVVNGFSLNGVAGGQFITTVDVTLVGQKPGSSKLSVLFTAYGLNAEDEFRPEAVEPITITVE